MRVLLLLAGRSRRFWPLTEKTLFPLCGKTLLEHQVSRLRAAGMTDIVLVGGAHNLAEARSLFPDLPLILQQDLDLGMRGALLSALPSCEGKPIMIVSGNDVIDPPAYKALAAAAKQKGTAGAILAQKVQQYFPGGYLTLEKERIAGIVEKPGAGNEPSNLVNIVAHVHNDPSALLRALEHVDESRDDGYEQALQKLFPAHSYRAVPYDGIWCAVKYPWHLLSLLPVFLSGIAKQRIHPSASVHPSAVISGPVVIEEGVKVLPNATIVGPCHIGKGSVIANNALVRQSSVHEQCVIGFSSEVKGSILAGHVWTHMSYVGDSIIGRNVSFGGGSITGNLRLDERTVSSVVDGEKISTNLTKLGAIIGDDCRIGIQTTMNPGVKIGSGTFVSSGSLIEEDIPDRMFARMRAGVLHLTPNSVLPPLPGDRAAFRARAGL